MRYTALALDYDGTIAHDSTVPAHVLEGLLRLKATGRKLVLVTGRELEELLGVFPGIAAFDRVVAENGALLYRPGTRERVALGERPPRKLVERLQAAGIPLAVGHTIVATVRPHEGVVLDAIASLGLEQQVIFNKGAVMVLPPGCNKATGLARALAELGLSARNVVAAGDGENDHALLDMSEYSVATANAVETLKQSADRVTNAPRGDGVLEVVAGLIESDLAQMPPRRPRRTLCLGLDPEGAEVLMPRRRASVLLAGNRVRARGFASALLGRLRKSGYQCCVIDTRGDYLGLEDTVAFGTERNAPSVEEALSALARPEVQTLVCLAALPAAGRAAFVQSLLPPLRSMRESSGRPHWILLDDANELAGSGAAGDEMAVDAVENTIYVASEALALSPGVLAGVEGIAVADDGAGAVIGDFARAVSWPPPAIPSREVRPGEALVWFRRTERPVAVIDVGALDAPAGDRAGDESDALPANARVEKSAEVGQVLRRA